MYEAQTHTQNAEELGEVLTLRRPGTEKYIILGVDNGAYMCYTYYSKRKEKEYALWQKLSTVP